MHLCKSPNFLSFWAYFDPMDQILTKFLKFLVLEARNFIFPNWANFDREMQFFLPNLEKIKFLTLQGPKTQNWPPKAPMGPRNAKKGFTHPSPVQ